MWSGRASVERVWSEWSEWGAIGAIGASGASGASGTDGLAPPNADTLRNSATEKPKLILSPIPSPEVRTLNPQKLASAPKPSQTPTLNPKPSTFI